MKIIVGKGSCGIAAGANKVSESAEKYIKEKGLDIPVTVTGCIGMCYLEPIIDVVRDDGTKTTYVKVNAESVREIIDIELKGETNKDYAISEAEYEAYYKSYYESTAAGLRQIKLKGIFCTEEEKINEVYGRLQNGDDFEELYNEYNVSEIAWGDGGNITLHQNELEGEWGEFIGVEEGFISKPEEINNGFVVFRVMEIKESSREEVIAKLREDYTNSVWQNIFSAEFEKWQMESSIYRNEEAWNKIEVDV